MSDSHKEHSHGHDDAKVGHDTDHGDFSYEDFDDKKASPEEEIMLESSGILSDIVWSDETDEADRVIDLGIFFPISKVHAIQHNRKRAFFDLAAWKWTIPHFQKPKILRITPHKKQYCDILSSKKTDSPILGYFWKERVVRMSVCDITEPLGELPHNTLDVRSESAPDDLPKQLHPDIFAIPIPLGRKMKRFFKHHSRLILRSSLVVAAMLGILSIAAIALASYTMKWTQEAYDGFRIMAEHFADKDAFAAEAEDTEQRFSRLSAIIGTFGFLFDNSLYHEEKIRTASHVISGWLRLARAAREFSDIRLAFVKEAGSDDIKMAFSSGSTFKATNFVWDQKKAIESISKEIKWALAEYSQITTLWDAKADAKLHQATSLLLTTDQIVDGMVQNLDTIMIALWHEKPMRYLILNQNRDELRAMGGFPGSAILVEWYKWRLMKYEKKDIYFYDWHLFPFAEKAPPGIDRITDKFGLRDANYYPEIATNFETIDRLFQKAGGSSLDGIVAYNQSVVLDFLARYGGVEIPSIRKTIDANNFSLVMSTLVEAKIGKVNTPKDVLFEFIEHFEKKLLAIKDFTGYYEILAASAKSGEILAYSNDPRVWGLTKKVLASESWNGNASNFVYPIFTSISGNKSDRYMSRSFDISATSASGCSVLNHFTLDSTHGFNTSEALKVSRLFGELGIPPSSQEELARIEWGGENRQYIRLLVPKNASIVGNPPIKIDIDNSSPNYTIFAWYTHTDVGNTSRVFFDYMSTPKNCQKDIQFFRQSGLTNHRVSTR